MRGLAAKGVGPQDRWTPSVEAGFTALEMVMAMALLVMVMLMGFKAVQIVLSVGNTTLSQSQATTAASLALTEMRQEVTSANILFNPATEGSNAGTNADGSTIAPGFSLRIYTQTNGIFTCIQWRVLDTRILQVRTWSNLWQTNGVVQGWTTLLTGIANPTSTPPFVLDEGANYGGTGSSRLLDVNLVLNTNNLQGNPVNIQSSIAGRDAEYYPQYSADCSSVPTP